MITLTPLDKKLVDKVYELEKQIFSDACSKNTFYEYFYNPNVNFIVAVQDEKILGYCAIIKSYESADILTLAVSEDYRRCGIGKSLLQGIIEHCIECGVEMLFLDVRCSNTAAIRLYESMGFEKISQRCGYYKNPCEDALIYRRVI